MKILDKLPEKWKEKATPTIEAILNLIPYAGGSIASIVSSYMTEKKMTKIIDAIDSLERIVRVNDIVIDKLLTEDQVCELFEKHLSEIAITSDETKIEFLKNSLNNSFISSTFEFEDKELFLNMLKNISSLEIIILRQIYLTDDPFVEKVYPSDLAPSVSTYIGSGIKFNNTFNRINFLKPKEYSVDSELYKSGTQSLEQYFKRKFTKQWNLLKGGCFMLDSKGLTNIKENLENQVYKEIKMKLVNENLINGLIMPTFSTNFNSNTSFPIIGKEAKTPFEGSKTDFGNDFINYVTK